MLKLFGVSQAIPILLAAIFFAHSGFAFDSTVSSKRPKIGLALSGGGARGTAHVGVLRLLEEQHIPIDYIAGTSMGSIIGGLYASGMTPDEIEKNIAAIDWEHIFSDAPPRKDRTYRRKRDDDLYLIKMKPGIEGAKLKFPTGAIQGQKFDLALRELTMSVLDVTDFDDLYIPFRAIASDISTGKKVVLSSGDLAKAMRASMAVPGIFAATEIDGRLLVDGGITSNLPINEVREMGADIVIAVDIGSPSLPAEEVNNFFKITSQLISIMTRTNVEQQIATLAENDVLIVPELGGFSSGNFVDAADIIPLGYKGAESQLVKLSSLSMSPQDYEQHLISRGERPSKSNPFIHFVKVENNSSVGDELIRDRVTQPMGEELNTKQLEQDISNIYGLDLFQTIHYSVIEDEGETGLLINANAKSWGPNYMQFGIKLSSDQQSNNTYNLGLAHLRTGVNSLGGEIRVGLQVGESPTLVADWHQPLESLSNYFVSANTQYGARPLSVFDDDGERLVEFRIKEFKTGFSVGREFDQFGEARIGYRYKSGEVKVSVGDPGLSEFHYETGEIYGRVAADRLDDYDFPTQGWLASLEYSFARDAFGGDSDIDQVKLRANRFGGYGDGHVFGLFGSASSTLRGNAPIQDRFSQGGFLNLSGFPDNSLSGQHEGILGLVYYRHYDPLPFFSWYMGGSLEYGGVWEDKSDFFNDGHKAASIFLGADTTLGPLYIGYGQAESGQHSVFFYLGSPRFQ